MSLSPRLYLAAGLLTVVAVAAGVSAYLVLSKPSYDSRTVMVATAQTPDGKPPGADAQVLAAQITSGALPLTFTVTSIQTVPR